MLLPGVYVCDADMCAYGMRVENRPNKKATQRVTNSTNDGAVEIVNMSRWCMDAL